MDEFLKVALSGPVRVRAIKVALVVGTLLNLINQGDTLLAGTFNLAKILATYLVPYCVSTYSAASVVVDQNRAHLS